MDVLNQLISIIVPIYKCEDYLDQCIRSLISQNYLNIEIILVDDGSPDRCPEICDIYAKCDSRIKVIHQPNGGLVSARKAGLALSTGKYIGYVDGDDWVEPEMYENLYQVMMENNADIVVSGYKEDICDYTKCQCNSIKKGLYCGADLHNEVYNKMICNGKFSHFGIFTYLWNKLFKREILYSNQMQVDNRIFIGEDAACLYPALLDSQIVYVTDSCYYHYRQRVNSMMKTIENYEREFVCFDVLYTYLKNIFSQADNSECLLRQLDLFILSLVTVRFDCLLSKKSVMDTLFPYSNVKIGNRVVLFGAGTFGQHTYRRLTSIKNINFILWVDPNYLQYRKFGLPVCDPETITRTDYDNVVIGFIDEINAQTAKTELISMGIDDKRIVWIDYDFENPKVILKQFGL